jgi:hypothetical protein
MSPPDQGAGEAGEPAPARRRSGWPDRIAGVLLGILLGIAVVTAFVFLGSETTIDAPRISGVDTGKGPSGGRKPAPLVRVVGGAPPPSGPVRLASELGSTVRFTVDSDAAIGIEVPGYGVSETVDAGRSEVSFRAKKPGQYAVVVAASHIAVATLRVARRR